MTQYSGSSLSVWLIERYRQSMQDRLGSTPFGRLRGIGNPCVTDMAHPYLFGQLTGTSNPDRTLRQAWLIEKYWQPMQDRLGPSLPLWSTDTSDRYQQSRQDRHGQFSGTSIPCRTGSAHPYLFGRLRGTGNPYRTGAQPFSDGIVQAPRALGRREARVGWVSPSSESHCWQRLEQNLSMSVAVTSHRFPSTQGLQP